MAETTCLRTAHFLPPCQPSTFINMHDNNICVNATQSENAGIKNASYFRWLYSALTSCDKSAIINTFKITNLSE